MQCISAMSKSLPHETSISVGSILNNTLDPELTGEITVMTWLLVLIEKLFESTGC